MVQKFGTSENHEKLSNPMEKCTPHIEHSQFTKNSMERYTKQNRDVTINSKIPDKYQLDDFCAIFVSGMVLLCGRKQNLKRSLFDPQSLFGTGH